MIKQDHWSTWGKEDLTAFAHKLARDLPLPKTECTHWWQHTVYGSSDPKRNGTWCQVCGKKLH